jgi:NitT/TauT family transport system substrate-binding protein
MKRHQSLFKKIFSNLEKIQNPFSPEYLRKFISIFKKEKPVIKIGHLKITDHLILGIGQYWIDNKTEFLNYFDLETVPVIDWNDIKNLLSDGSINAAFILSPLAMSLFRTGEKIKLILLGHKNGSILIKSKKGNIKKIEDFKGKEVIIPHQLSVHNMLFHKMLGEKGLVAGPGADVLLEVISPSMIPDMIRDFPELGGFIVAEPFGSQVIKEGLGEEFALSKDVWPNHPCCVLVVKDELINSYPKAIQELTDLMVKAGKYVSREPMESAKIGAEFLNQDVDIIEKVLTQPKDRITTDELMPILEDLEYIQTYMTEKMTKGMVGKIALEQFVDTRFAKAAGA